MAEYVDIDVPIIVTDAHGREISVTVRHILEKNNGKFDVADVAERRCGKWIDTDPAVPDWSSRKGGMSYYCSCCMHPAGKYKHKTYKYCPWCGAKMGVDE